MKVDVGTVDGWTRPEQMHSIRPHSKVTLRLHSTLPKGILLRSCGGSAQSAFSRSTIAFARRRSSSIDLTNVLTEPKRLTSPLAQETRTQAVHVSPRRVVSMSRFVPLLEFNPDETPPPDQSWSLPSPRQWLKPSSPTSGSLLPVRFGDSSRDFAVRADYY